MLKKKSASFSYLPFITSNFAILSYKNKPMDFELELESWFCHLQSVGHWKFYYDFSFFVCTIEIIMVSYL